jgi:hypothetical protein
VLFKGDAALPFIMYGGPLSAQNGGGGWRTAARSHPAAALAMSAFDRRVCTTKYDCVTCVNPSLRVTLQALMAKREPSIR